MHAIGAESPCRASAPLPHRTSEQRGRPGGRLPIPTSSTCGRLSIPPIVATACTCGSAFDPPPVPLPSPSLFFSHSQAVANGSLRVPLLGFIDNGVLPKESHTLATNRRFAKITSLRRRFRSPLRYADLRNRRSQNKPCLTRLPVFRKTTTGRHLRTAFA